MEPEALDALLGTLPKLVSSELELKTFSKETYRKHGMKYLWTPFYLFWYCDVLTLLCLFTELFDLCL